MSSVASTPFLQMIRQLRQREEVFLYDRFRDISEREVETLIDFMHGEYDAEAINHPFTVPAFNSSAAIWAARTIYISAQLLLYRDSKPEELIQHLPDFKGERNPSAILTADLCLRFLPAILTQLKLIDPDDELIELLEARLSEWHYSGITYPLEIAKLNFEPVLQDECLRTLYCERIIENKNLTLAQHPAFQSTIQSFLGIHGEQLWKEFKTTDPFSDDEDRKPE
jgi:hypothetical protein